ncbi:MAG: NPCBM-associated, NEW3 domain of alpha-galactosidase [uncultured archaeon A07HB70]|nr:MAG: NPCBM-associated, NEW3 domain of alpha-galactosidase [uncultured archaeon A07HB70]
MNCRRATVLVLSALLVSAALALPAGANTVIIGEPDITATSPTGTVQASEETTLTVAVTNDGELERGDQRNPRFEDRVTTARNVRVEVVESGIDAPVDVKTGTQTLGRLPTSQTTPLEYRIEVGAAEPGTYRVPVRIEYSHTRSVVVDEFEQPEFTTVTRTVRTSVQIRVEARPQFQVTGGDADSLFAGDTDRLSLTVENTGTRTATDTRLDLSAGAPAVFFGPTDAPQRQTGVFVGRLAPGEQREVSVRVGATGDAAPGSYPVQTNVVFENPNGVTGSADPQTVGVTVGAERRFALRNVETERFRVDESKAQITADLANTGEAPARQVVVRMQNAPDSPVTPTNGESAVGDLAPGESAPVSFTISVAQDAEPGTNSFAFAVEYENAAGNVRTVGDPIRQALTIEPRMQSFVVTDVSTEVSPGGSANLDVTLRYNGEEPVSAVNARLFPTDPLSSADDGAFLGQMAPGETATATFAVSAGSSALPKTYDSSVQVRYDDTDGDTQFTDGLPVGVSVSQSDGGPPVVPIAVGAVIVLAGGAYVLLRRR